MSRKRETQSPFQIQIQIPSCSGSTWNLREAHGRTPRPSRISERTQGGSTRATRRRWISTVGPAVNGAATCLSVCTGPEFDYGLDDLGPGTMRPRSAGRVRNVVGGGAIVVDESRRGATAPSSRKECDDGVSRAAEKKEADEHFNGLFDDEECTRRGDARGNKARCMAPFNFISC